MWILFIILLNSFLDNDQWVKSHEIEGQSYSEERILSGVKCACAYSWKPKEE